MPEAPIIFQPHFAAPYYWKQRSYQLLELPNGIHGLVITDPSEDLASCSLTVATGHHANPDNIPGLAHLCEHMISLSSKDFPEIDAYRKAVHYAGGTHNALTTNETTSFYFSIPMTSSTRGEQSDFGNILDIFTSNFKNPSFEANFSNREIYAVDNEHTINKTKRQRLAFQGYKLLANNKHPFSSFSTGNFESLTNGTKNQDIKSQLNAFFVSEYTPDKMAFVLRGPQSLNYLQKLAISNFSKLGGLKNARINHPIHVASPPSWNILEEVWSKRYICKAYNAPNLQRVVLINKDLDPLFRLAFPICLNDSENLSKKQIMFFVDFWCEIFGSESDRTVASELAKRELIVSMTTKTSSVTYDTILLEMEMLLTPQGMTQIATILDLIFNYISLLSTNFSKFVKHLAKAMSQFNGICMYNFLNAGAESSSVWEERFLSKNMLFDFNTFGQFFIRGFHIYDHSSSGFCGGYLESDEAKTWWLKEAKSFCTFLSSFLSFDKSLVTLVAKIEDINLNWVDQLPGIYSREPDFHFEFKIGVLKPSIVKINKEKYNLGIPPPNIFADDIVNNQKELLYRVSQTIENSANAALGYSVKNMSSFDAPRLFHHDQGCQLWIKKESDFVFKNKELLTIELVNTKIGAHPSFVAVLEILVQLIKSRVNSYLYQAFTMGYCYDLFPSFKGDSGILLHVSGPNTKFNDVLAVLIDEIKLITDSFVNCVLLEEFKKARKAVLLKYENAKNLSSMETASLGLMASIEENTWMLDQRIESCEKTTIDTMAHLLPQIFSSCYLTALLQGDIDECSLKNEILPAVTRLVEKFEGEDYKFPSSVMLPPGSSYFVHSSTKDHTNCVEYFLQTCTRDDITKRSLTKFIAFAMSASLVGKIRTEYQLGYISLVGLKSLRRTQGIHIIVVSGSHSAESLDLKLDDLIMEWFDQSFKNLKNSQLDELIDKFVTTENSVNKLLTTTSGQHSLFFGILGSSGGDKKIVKQHNSYWEQIENKTYSFSKNIQGEDAIDMEVIKQLNVDAVVNFVKKEILPTSIQRRKLSVLVDSKCSKEEIESKFKTIQLYIFLSSMGLPIKKEHLDEILVEAGDSQVTLAKLLYKYYRGKGKSVTLIVAVMARLSKSLLFSSSESATKAETALQRTEIDGNHLREWQYKVGFIRDKMTMKEKLQAF